MVVDEYLPSGVTPYGLVSKVASFSEERDAPIFCVNRQDRNWAV
jgi:hypothetical protein